MITQSLNLDIYGHYFLNGEDGIIQDKVSILIIISTKTLSILYSKYCFNKVISSQVNLYFQTYFLVYLTSCSQLGQLLATLLMKLIFFQAVMIIKNNKTKIHKKFKKFI